jgi:regulator of replication initiation timing
VDKFQKERAVSDNLRAQLKEALDENARLARELTELKRLTKKAAKEAKESKENN